MATVFLPVLSGSSATYAGPGEVADPRADYAATSPALLYGAWLAARRLPVSRAPRRIRSRGDLLVRKNAFVTEEESLRRFGLRPTADNLEQVRAVLADQVMAERRSQGDGDTELMKLCCVQLFNAGLLSDVLLIWRAKESSWDMHCSVDVQLLCGAGLEETKTYLAAEGTDDSAAALRYLLDCEAAGDLQDFSVARHSEFYANYYLS
jgi:hypothetical protein